jgi:CRP-like cAMP-binding protein
LTRGDCRLAPVSEERFLLMVKETPEFSLQVMRVLAERLRRTTAKV